MSNVAVTYTVKDEERLLSESIQYFRNIGIKMFIIFLDNNYDGTRNTFGGQSDVIVLDSLEVPSGVEVSSEWVKNLYDRVDEGFDIRKVINTYIACKICMMHDCSWIISIDVDELLSPRCLSGNLPIFLSQFDQDIQQVRFRNNEIINYHHEIYDNTLLSRREFKKHPDAICKFFLKSLSKISFYLRINCFAKDILENFILVFFGYVLVSHLFTKDFWLRPKPYFNGYIGFKSAFRASYCDDFEFSIHYWVDHFGLGLRSVDVDGLFHYDTICLEHFIEKFSKSAKIASDTPFVYRKKIIDDLQSAGPSKAEHVYSSMICQRRNRFPERAIISFDPGN